MTVSREMTLFVTVEIWTLILQKLTAKVDKHAVKFCLQQLQFKFCLGQVVLDYGTVRLPTQY